MKRLTFSKDFKDSEQIGEVKYISPELAKQLYDRLAEYEDTCISPERCAELAKAEKEGRLLIMPCKPKENCYIANGKRPAIKITVSRFEYNIWQDAWLVHAANDAAFFLSDAYATREEAEKTLESEGT